MTNQNTAWIAGLIFVAVVADFALNSGNASEFLVLKLIDLVEDVMFWR